MLQFEDLKDVYEYHYFRIYLREDRQNSWRKQLEPEALLLTAIMEPPAEHQVDSANSLPKNRLTNTPRPTYLPRTRKNRVQETPNLHKIRTASWEEARRFRKLVRASRETQTLLTGTEQTEYRNRRQHKRWKERRKKKEELPTKVVEISLGSCMAPTTTTITSNDLLFYVLLRYVILFSDDETHRCSSKHKQRQSLNWKTQRRIRIPLGCRWEHGRRLCWSHALQH